MYKKFDNNYDNEWENIKKANGRNYKDSNQESYRRLLFNYYIYSTIII